MYKYRSNIFIEPAFGFIQCNLVHSRRAFFWTHDPGIASAILYQLGYTTLVIAYSSISVYSLICSSIMGTCLRIVPLLPSLNIICNQMGNCLPCTTCTISLQVHQWLTQAKMTFSNNNGIEGAQTIDTAASTTHCNGHPWMYWHYFAASLFW